MRSPRLEQGLFLFSFICTNMLFVVCFGVAVTFTDKLFFINVLTLLFVAIWVAVAAGVFKMKPIDLYKNKGPRFVNTAAGPRREDIENGHPARAADGGVLMWKPSVVSPGLLAMIPVMLTVISVFKMIAFVVAMLLRGTGLVPFQTALMLGNSKHLMLEVLNFVLHVAILLAFIAVIKHRHGLKGAPLFTVVYALLVGNSTIFTSAYGVTPKLTFLDPVSGRVRRVFRESDEDFEPSKSKAGAWAAGLSASGAGA